MAYAVVETRKTPAKRSDLKPSFQDTYSWKKRLKSEWKTHFSATLTQHNIEKKPHVVVMLFAWKIRKGRENKSEKGIKIDDDVKKVGKRAGRLKE